MKFGINLKKLRKSKKLSQEDLADRMKVSRQSVSKIGRASCRERVSASV